MANNLDNVEGVDFNFVEKNITQLASVYNQYLTDEYRDRIVIFVHDDVCLADFDFVEKCQEAAKLFDVFGVAGGSKGFELTSDKPCLWHLISNEKVGVAGHFADEAIDVESPYNTQHYDTTFGETPASATLLDGVFLGVNVEKVLEAGVTFDEECPAKFHFYDLLFSVRAKVAGLSLGVYPFKIFHASHGLKEFTKEFMDGDLYFRKYCGTLV